MHLSPSTFRAYAEIPSSYPENQPYLDVNLTTGDIFRVLVPSASNVSLLSLSGGQYDAGLYSIGTKNEFLFTPDEIANYTLSLNLSGSASYTVNLGVVGAASESSWSKNITVSAGEEILNIEIIVLPEQVSQSSGWNPLFGFTGISLGGITLSSTDILAMFAAFSILLMGVGAMRSQKLLYLGLFSLSLIGMIVVGILVVAIIAGSYLGGFLVIRSYYGYRSRRQSGDI